jgi:hypothetical protein
VREQGEGAQALSALKEGGGTMRHLGALALVALLFAACTDEARQSYLSLSGRLFIFNPRVASATYVVTLAINKSPPAGSRVIATFDNPAGGPQLVVDQKIFPAQEKLSLESPNLICIKKGRRYAFQVVLKDAAGQELQRVESSIESTLDQSIMPDAPLVQGPAYEPNKLLKGKADGKIDGLAKPPCPA